MHCTHLLLFYDINDTTIFRSILILLLSKIGVHQRRWHPFGTTVQTTERLGPRARLFFYPLAPAISCRGFRGFTVNAFSIIFGLIEVKVGRFWNVFRFCRRKIGSTSARLKISRKSSKTRQISDWKRMSFHFENVNSYSFLLLKFFLKSPVPGPGPGPGPGFWTHPRPRPRPRQNLPPGRSILGGR